MMAATTTESVGRNRIARGGLAALVGGVLWALWPLGTPIFFETLGRTGDIDLQGRIYGMVATAALALLVVGLVSLHRLHKGHYGRIGVAGFVLSLSALVLMLPGLSMDALAYGTQLSELGHMAFLIGFLVSILGSIVLGFAIRRARVLPRARWVGPLLAVAIPLGIAAMIVGESVAPGPGDLWFWIAIATPYGSAWAVLGSELRSVSGETVAEDTSSRTGDPDARME